MSAHDVAVVYAPSDDLEFPSKDERLSGTGVTEDGTTVALPIGIQAELLAGNTPLRMSFRTLVGQNDQVETTSRILAANTSYQWMVTDETKAVYIEAADGVTAYEAWVSKSGKYS